jgi:hypothetical protein
MSPLTNSNERGRFAAGLLLLGVVHVGLFVQGGNDNATPSRLLASFALSTTLLWLSQLARRRLREQRAARVSAPGATRAATATASTANADSKDP